MNWYEAVGRWADDHRREVDEIGAAVLVAIGVPLSVALRSSDSFGFSPGLSVWLVAVLALAVIAPLAIRRSRPVLSVVLVYSAALLHMLLGLPLILPADLAVLAALFSVTVYGPRWAHRVAIGSGLVGSLALGVFAGSAQQDILTGIIFVPVFVGPIFLATWAFGLVRRARRDTINALRDRASRLETERDQQARIATTAERSRIAREMHDIVAHSLSVMIAQADGGRYMAADDPPAAARTLGTIAETGRSALADMRRLLGVLRDEPDSGPSPVVADLAPQPAAEDIASLVSRVRESGVRASLVRMGEPRTLPPGTGLTLYRVCQEALTNILKHAGPDPTVTVVLTWGRASVRLEVDDDGRGASVGSDGAGQGLVGMRERATMFGGVFAAGPRPGGGFRVMLDLPLPERRAEPRATPADQPLS